MDEKPYGSILVYIISYKTLIGSKPLWIRFHKIDGFIRVYGNTKYLVLFGSGKYDLIYNMIRYIIGVQSGITHVISFNFARIKVDSYGFFEKLYGLVISFTRYVHSKSIKTLSLH